MSGLIKYRVHEVAKDFGMTSKEITQILTDYATTPKNHMQVLEDDELNDIFEYLTQHHQAASLEELYKVPDQPKAKPQAAPAAQAEAPKAEATPAKQAQQASQPQQQDLLLPVTCFRQLVTAKLLTQIGSVPAVHGLIPAVDLHLLPVIVSGHLFGVVFFRQRFCANVHDIDPVAEGGIS